MEIFFHKTSLSRRQRDRWYSTAKLKEGSKETKELYLLFDTGSDFTAIPMHFADYLDIDLENQVNEGLQSRWDNGGARNPLSFMRQTNWTDLDNKAIEESYECACGNENDSFVYPLEIIIGNGDPFYLPVQFIEANITPLLGRIGIFDRGTDLELNLLKGHGYLSAD